jgi:aspartoacylase
MNEKPIKRVAITGGTHGNELIGVYLVKKWLNDGSSIKRPNIEVTPFLLNKEAIKERVRYIDRDLNRCFNKDTLESQSEDYEVKLAKEINEKLGPKGSDDPKYDFIVDLHTTTANMGLSIVVSNESKITWRAISYLKMMNPSIRVYRWRGDQEDSFVDSIAPHGFAIEVGPTPQAVLRGDLFLATEKLVYQLLDFLDRESGDPLDVPITVEVYDHQMLLDYPRDKSGDITAMIHPDRQDRDFEPISNGSPLFLTLEGETLSYEGEEMYALFINEAAYYEKGFAMTLAKRRLLTLS